MQPTTEFRTAQVSGAEPSDRTIAGSAAGGEITVDLGELDTTDEPGNIPVRVFWWRVIDMNDAQEITNIRVWLDGTDSLTGSNTWYLDITDTWTPGKTHLQVVTGSPGVAPLAESAATLERLGGGAVTGITHDQTSAYIYLTGRIGLDEPAGVITGLKLKIRYNYR